MDGWSKCSDKHDATTCARAQLLPVGYGDIVMYCETIKSQHRYQHAYAIQGQRFFRYGFPTVAKALPYQRAPGRRQEGREREREREGEREEERGRRGKETEKERERERERDSSMEVSGLVRKHAQPTPSRECEMAPAPHLNGFSVTDLHQALGSSAVEQVAILSTSKSGAWRDRISAVIPIYTRHLEGALKALTFFVLLARGSYAKC